MQHRNPVTGKIRGVEGKDALNAIHQHRGDKACVKSPVAADLVHRYQPLSVLVDPRIVRQQLKGLLDPIDRGRRRGNAEPEAVLSRRAGRRRPEFGDVLRRYMDRLATFDQLVGACDRGPMMRMSWFESAQQYVGVDEDAQSCRPPGKSA